MVPKFELSTSGVGVSKMVSGVAKLGLKTGLKSVSGRRSLRTGWRETLFELVGTEGRQACGWNEHLLPWLLKNGFCRLGRRGVDCCSVTSGLAVGFWLELFIVGRYVMKIRDLKWIE